MFCLPHPFQWPSEHYLWGQRGQLAPAPHDSETMGLTCSVGGARNRALRRDREAICDVTGPRMNGLQTKGIQTEKVKISWLRRAATETHENGCVTAD